MICAGSTAACRTPRTDHPSSFIDHQCRLRQLVAVLVDLGDRVGDVVHILLAGQQHLLADPDRFLAEPVIVGIVQLVAVASSRALRSSA